MSSESTRQGLRAAAASAWIGAIVLLACGVSFVRADELFVEGSVSGVLARDLDGDGFSEMLVSYHRDERRFLAVFRGGKTYARAPEHVVPVDPQAVLFAVGDHDPAPGLELVLISRGSGVIYPLGDSASGDYRRLFKTDLFFNMPSVTRLPVWLSRSALDLDGDGREDFVLPEKNKLRVLARRENEGEEVRWGGDWKLGVSYYLLIDGRRQRMRKAIESFADVNQEQARVLETSGAFPFPVFTDFDGDGRVDIVTKQFGNVLTVFLQKPSGGFDAEPQISVEIPWAGDLASLIIDDLDGDGRQDLLASRILLKELATEIRVFEQDSGQPGHGFLKPRQILQVSGLFRRPALGTTGASDRKDLLVATYRLDLLQQLEGDTVDELEITYQIFPAGTDTPFRRRPSFKQKFPLKTGLFRRGRRRPPIYIGNDLTGDGRSDVLFIDNGGWLRLYRGRSGGSLAYDEVKEFAVKVREPKRVSLVNLDDAPGEEAVLEFSRSVQVLRHDR